MRVRTTSVLALLAFAAAAHAQSTAFTYQGRLKNGAALASGLHDFRFTLFNVVSGGVQLAPPQCVDNILVTEGLFTATLDFGQQFTTTEVRFLQIEVRADTGLTCVNTAGFTGLTPRQPLTAAPLATHAKSAFALDAADGIPANAVFVDNGGQVGIGTLSPTTSLHVQAPTGGTTPGAGVRITGTAAHVANLAYLDFFNSAGARMGYVGDGGGADNSIYLQSDSASVHLYTQVGPALTAVPNGNIGIGTTTPVNRLSVAGGGADISGSVGIGTTAPLAALDVRGDIRFGPGGQGVKAAGSVENLRMVRGTISALGSNLAGEGFTCQRTATGQYLITFTPPFAQVPSITTTADWAAGGDVYFFMVDNVTTSTSEVLGYSMQGPNFSDRAFHFIAVGPR